MIRPWQPFLHTCKSFDKKLIHWREGRESSSVREIRHITPIEVIIDIFADSDKYDYFDFIPKDIFVLAQSVRKKGIVLSDLDLDRLQDEFDGFMVSNEEVDCGFENAYDFACWLFGSENVAEAE